VHGKEIGKIVAPEGKDGCAAKTSAEICRGKHCKKIAESVAVHRYHGNSRQQSRGKISLWIAERKTAELQKTTLHTQKRKRAERHRQKTVTEKRRRGKASQKSRENVAGKKRRGKPVITASQQSVAEEPVEKRGNVSRKSIAE
jgi:hypothetical protein